MAQSRTSVFIDGSQAGGTLKQLKADVRSLNNEMNQLPIGSDKYNKKLDELKNKSQQLKAHKNDINGINGSYQSANKGLGGMIKQFAPMAGAIGIVTGVVGGAVAGVKDWLQTNMKMEKSLSSLKSLTGASADDIKFYKQEATNLGKSTTLSATEVVDAYKLIGSAKPELLKSKEALNQVTKETITLAEASEMELGGAAQSLTGIMNQFDLSASSSSRIINALAAGSKEGASDIASLSDSFDKSGSVMKGYNIEVEEGIGLLETLGEKNIKGAEAGTQLRNVLLTMQGVEALPQKAIDALEKYGVNTSIVADKTLPLQDRLKEMSKISGDATSMMEVFGKENIVAGSAILGNVDKVGKLTEAVTGTQTAYEQASINTDNLDGDLKSLGSAWEGLTLSLDGGGAVFRPIIQAGTDMLNWVSDSIVAFKNWDTRSMDTQVLKLAKTFTFFNPVLEDFLDHQIKIKEIGNEVIAAIKDESEAVAVSIKTIDANNKKLKESNITEEESARLKEENAQFIDALNEKYPELTSQIDLNSASSSELSNLQKQINANLLEQALNASIARESERLLDEIVQKSIDISRKRREEQKIMADGTVSAFESIGLLWNGTSSSAEKEKKKLEGDLKGLGKLRGEVEKELSGIDFQFGASFDENSKIVETSLKEMNRLTKQLASTSNVTQRKIIEADIKAQESMLKSSNKNLSESQKNALALLNKTTESEVAATEAREKAAAKQATAAKAARDEIKKLREELEGLKKTYEDLSNDIDYSKRLAAFTDEQAKELFELEKTTNDKFAREIESLEALSKRKGEIGKQAQEQLNALLILKTEDFEWQKQAIEAKYLEQKKDLAYNAQKEANLLYLQQQESLEQSIVDLKVSEAAMGVKAASNATLAEQRNAESAMRSALIDQLKREKVVKLSALQDQYSNDAITHEEFLNRKKILDQEYADASVDIANASSDKINTMTMDRVSNIGNAVQNALSAFSQLSDAQFDKRQKELDKSLDSEILNLEKKYANREITEEQYQASKLQLEESTNAKKNELANQQAAKQKQAAKAQAVVGAALAIIQAFAQLGPIAGAIAAVTVGVATLAQISQIDGAEVEQYADGGYHNVIGAKDGKNYRAKNLGRHQGGMLPGSPSLVLTSERGPEYFVPNHLLSNPAVMNNVRVIEAIRTNQYAEGGFTQPTTAVTVAGENDELMKAVYSVLSALNAKIPNMGVTIRDQQISDLIERGKELDALKS